MYVIREKRSKKVLHVQFTEPGQKCEAKDIYPAFKPESMEVGQTDDLGVPAWFDIKDGKVVPKDPPPPEVHAVAAAEMTLDEIKQASIATLSEQSMIKRRELIPDYQMHNAALGVYDEKQTRAVRDTVKAFRDEFYRLKAQIEKAKTKKDLQAVKPAFPEKIAGEAGGRKG